MTLPRSFASACVVFLVLLWSVPAQSADPVPMTTAWMGEHETFAVWYGKEKGWDKEEGLDLSMLRFDSGKSLVEGMLAYKWAIAGCGAVPALTAALSDRLVIIAVANDESAANALYVRSDSPILRIKGSNPAFPDVCGDRVTVAGAQILCPQGTSAQYLMSAWLRVLGLTEKDVKIKYMEPTPALGSFAGGLGDVVALWAPQTYEAEQKGFRLAANSRACGVSQPVLLVADREFADKNPQQVEAFLKMYFRAVSLLRETAPEVLAPEYIRFHKEWSGRELSIETAVQDLKNHPVFLLEEQLALFDTGQSKSRLQNWLLEIANFFAATGSIRAEDMPRLQRMNAVTDVFLKAIRFPEKAL